MKIVLKKRINFYLEPFQIWTHCSGFFFFCFFLFFQKKKGENYSFWQKTKKLKKLSASQLGISLKNTNTKKK
jgi:hypothetical protein